VDVSAPLKAGDQIFTWTRFPSEASAGEINFGPRYPGIEEGEAYAYATTKIVSDMEQDALLVTGTNAALAVWINGEKVTDYETNGSAYPDMNHAYVRLQKGENLFLTRTRSGRGWEFYLRLADYYGHPLENVRAVMPQNNH